MNRRSFLFSVINFLAVLAASRGNSLDNYLEKGGPTVELRKKNPGTIIYRTLNGGPRENVRMLVSLMGGMRSLIREEDVVLIKPNGQWWNQGSTNLAALVTFIELVFEMKGFSGEVVILENCHRGNEPWKSPNSAWNRTFERNSDLPGSRSMNDICTLLKERHGDSFSVVHLINVSAGGPRIHHPEQAPGYIYCDGSNGTDELVFDNGRKGELERKSFITYPVIKTDRGTIVDLRKGIWTGNDFRDDTVRLINFPALNHHSTYVGVTSAVKNYMGLVDLSGGADPDAGGQISEGFCNFHSFPFNGWDRGPVPGMLGLAIGVFMNVVRRADLNITTAQYVGLSSRVRTPVARTAAVLASKDPVALDYHCAKYVLFANSRIRFHDPDWSGGPLRRYLDLCAEQINAELDDRSVKVVSYDFSRKRDQPDGRTTVRAQVEWGSDLNALLKYAFLRYAPREFNNFIQRIK